MAEYLMPIALLVAGLGLLILGGELLVRGASALAVLVRISPLVIGLTVVAFGTSAPELAVSVQASYAGQPDLIIGNVVGSCICNVLLVLGVSALISPLAVSGRLVRLDVPLMIAASCLLLVLGLDGTISRTDGLGLVAALACYTAWSVILSRKELGAVKKDFEKHAPVAVKAGAAKAWMQLGLIACGLALLTLGSDWLVKGAVDVARLLGMSQLMIALTIVAVGTSMPEMATSALASLRGERDIAVGNVVGSNIMNVLGVLGLCAVLAPEGVGVSNDALRFDIPVMIAVAVACFPIFFSGHMIARWEGGLFFAYYLAYMAYLILCELQYETVRTFEVIMAGFVVPLTVITLLVGVARALRVRPAE